jgi:type 1 glutamine amidotransferase
MSITRSALLLAISLGLAGAQEVPDKFYFAEGKVRVLILSGRNNHDWRVTTPHLRRILESTGRFDVRVSEEPTGLDAATLRPYDVLVADYCGPRWGERAEAAVEAFVKSGKGLAVVHAASYPFGVRSVLGEKMGNTGVTQAPWPAWAAMVGASWREADPKNNIPRTGHGRRHVYKVKWTDRAHPIAAGLEESFTTSDELYFSFVMSPSIHVLATALNAKAEGGNDREEPLIWTNSYGKGRVFHTALGHDVHSQMAQGFIDSFARGTEWAANGTVSLGPTVSIDPKDKDAVRVLLVTGGHDHEASLYGIFEHDRRLRVNVDPHPVAYRGDLRKRYDVVVMYDMVQDLSDAQKKNLRDFAEAGKGIVVLHHAIASYQSWDWWWKDLVGGRYLLKDEPSLNMKGSTYLHDVDLQIEPSGKHPVLKGITSAWMRDETYKGMWRGPGIQTILTTKHPTSDEPLAWISPYAQSRVVYIQLGHGRDAHENPWYRRLVSNAILWSASREP